MSAFKLPFKSLSQCLAELREEAAQRRAQAMLQLTPEPEAVPEGKYDEASQESEVVLDSLPPLSPVTEVLDSQVRLDRLIYVM